MPHPSGEQLVIAHGSQQAVVTEVGANLRAYEVGGAPVLWGFDLEEMCSGGRGQVLAPWPNRLEDGTYRFEGKTARAALDEPERSNAIHGIVRWLAWVPELQEAERVRLSVLLHPQPAYPFDLRLSVTYELSDEGLSVRTDAVNVGNGACPFGLGFHPYLLAGPDGVDRSTLELPARRRLLSDERCLPTGSEPVAGSPYERLVGAPAGAAIGDLHVDDCFTELAVGAGGRWRARFWPSGADSSGSGPGARPIMLWADESFRYAMCFTGDSLESPDRRKALALEPMTCAPNALRTGEGLVVLGPGESFSATWGIVQG